MKFVLFTHSFVSCWNHGNAHFLRGIVRDLVARGHHVTVFEPADGWSRANALADGGERVLAEARALVPGVDSRFYDLATLDLSRAVADADVVIVHEWNEPALVSALGRLRGNGQSFTLLFHDTHHRAVTAPDEIARFDLEHYDAVLAFGDVLARAYRANRWADEVFTWHEAADTALFHPPARARHPDLDLIWIGNWGDDERDLELREFLLDPISALGLRARIHGVRYPQAIKAELAERGIEYAGWLPNAHAPEAFARARVTVHVPRRPYVAALPGIPTIRVFEALACGIPMVSAPWDDAEGLFPAGAYISVRDGEGMKGALRRVLHEPELAQALARTGLDAIQARHTCSHRVDELLNILKSIGRGHSDMPAVRQKVVAS